MKYCIDCYNKIFESYSDRHILDYSLTKSIKNDLRDNYTLNDLVIKYNYLHYDILRSFFDEFKEYNNIKLKINNKLQNNILINIRTKDIIDDIEIGEYMHVKYKETRWSFSIKRVRDIRGIVIYKNYNYILLDTGNYKECVNVCYLNTGELEIII